MGSGSMTGLYLLHGAGRDEIEKIMTTRSLGRAGTSVPGGQGHDVLRGLRQKGQGNHHVLRPGRLAWR